MEGALLMNSGTTASADEKDGNTYLAKNRTRRKGTVSQSRKRGT